MAKVVAVNQQPNAWCIFQRLLGGDINNRKKEEEQQCHPRPTTLPQLAEKVVISTHDRR